MRWRALWLLVTAACQRTNSLELTFGPTQGDYSEGFRCRDPNKPTAYLLTRSLANGTYTFAAMFDVVKVGGVTDCNGDDIFTSCASAACPALPATHECRDIVATPPPMATIADILDSIVADFKADPTSIYSDAPDGVVMIRVAFVTGTCASNGAEPRYTATNVIGCGYTCPAILDDEHGTLPLEFDTPDEITGSDGAAVCDRDVVICAQLGQ